MKTVKTIAVLTLFFAFIGGPLTAQDKKDTKKEMPLKEHKCTAACKNGKHAYAHGEKGHVCGSECKKKAA